MALILSASVGAGASNQADDVEALQKALQHAAVLTLDHRLDPGPADGRAGDATHGAIARFQRRLGHSQPDSRVDPGGNTLQRLNALLGIGDINIAFPFTSTPSHAYVGPGSTMRAFGSSRSGGTRAHAGVDFYFPEHTDIRAIADGTVTRGPYDFYLGTRALEIDHGAFVARYGEIAPDQSPPVQEGHRVSKGQVVGRVGILKDSKGSLVTQGRLPSNMLHFEMYDKTQSGKLTRASGTSARHTNGSPFYRRRDLIDPSGFMMRAPLPA